MSDPVILRRLRLTQAHSPTGKTRHRSGGALLPPPAELRIAQYSNDPGYYLLHYDSDGREMTDTYHDSLEDAIAQAEWEFGAHEGEWEIQSGA
jgi:hypothetical protein